MLRSRRSNTVVVENGNLWPSHENVEQSEHHDYRDADCSHSAAVSRRARMRIASIPLNPLQVRQCHAAMPAEFHYNFFAAPVHAAYRKRADAACLGVTSRSWLRLGLGDQLGDGLLQSFVM